MSIAQSSFAEVLPRRRSARRIVLLGAVDMEPLLREISEVRGVNFEVARIIAPGQHGYDDELAIQLSPIALRRNNIWAVVVACDRQHRPPVSLMLQCQLCGIKVFDLTSFCEQHGCWIELDGTECGWMMSGNGFRHHRAAAVRKRISDLLIAATGLVVSFPLLLIIAVLIRIDSRGPALYRQERVGLGGQTFTLYKFRSMRQDAEPAGVPAWAAIDDPRITRVGRFIRYTRIDELPQLLNVLRGDMSVIGPRPERPYFVEKLAAEIPLYLARHYVKPGITGWAQVNAPYGASIEDTRTKLRYDLYYIKHCTLVLDLLILLRTIRVILLQEGAR